MSSQTHQFRMAYADYDIPTEHAAVFRDELLEELLDHQPKVEWQAVTDVGDGKFWVAVRTAGDERGAAAILADAMTKARQRVRTGAR